MLGWWILVVVHSNSTFKSNMQALVLIGPFGWQWWVWNGSICHKDTKWQNNYMCLNIHKIMYFFMIIIYYYDLILSMIVCVKYYLEFFQ
jgi:hypothetical protein